MTLHKAQCPLFISTALLCITTTMVIAQQDYSKVEIKTTALTESVYMISGAGGNENFGDSGAVIVAHDNVRQRMSTKQFMIAFGREVPASPDTALPVVTFSDYVTFHFNNDELSVMHQPAAHTDGDSIVMFSSANVLHMGDTFSMATFPSLTRAAVELWTASLLPVRWPWV